MQSAVFVQKRGTLLVDLLTPPLPHLLQKDSEYRQWHLIPAILLVVVRSLVFRHSAALLCFSVSGPCLVLSCCPGLWLGWVPGRGCWAGFLLPWCRSGLVPRSCVEACCVPSQEGGTCHAARLTAGGSGALVHS